MTVPTTGTETLDVLIIGAGITGIGAAHYLRTELPSKNFAILEARESYGGTWDLFKYPGLRSDSDLHTFGYEFKPWSDKQSIADADRIMAYLKETVQEDGTEQYIRYHHKVLGAAWSSAESLWTVDIEKVDTGERIQLKAQWIFCGSGYYNYDQGFAPSFPGSDRFTGEIVHPQHWPEDLDYKGKKVVVIGSGATAVTLLPAMADDAAHVTMLQRTPTYIFPLPREDVFATAFNKVFGEKRGYALTRKKNIAQQRFTFEFCQRFPTVARKVIRQVNKSLLPKGYPVDTHFNPPYNPWDQRICAVPNGDLFKTIRQGKTSVVTDRIETFTEEGIKLVSGEELEADIIVTATGLNLKVIGGIDLNVDGADVDIANKIVYRGTMVDGVPNFAFAIGYTNSSWTLKIGMLCEFFCQLIDYVDRNGYASVAPEAPEMDTRPLLDFDAGYVKRSLADLPKQGTEQPWSMSMSYYEDRKLLKGGDVADRRNLKYARAAAPVAEQSPESQLA